MTQCDVLTKFGCLDQAMRDQIIPRCLSVIVLVQGLQSAKHNGSTGRCRGRVELVAIKFDLDRCSLDGLVAFQILHCHDASGRLDGGNCAVCEGALVEGRWSTLGDEGESLGVPRTRDCLALYGRLAIGTVAGGEGLGSQHHSKGSF